MQRLFSQFMVIFCYGIRIEIFDRRIGFVLVGRYYDIGEETLNWSLFMLMTKLDTEWLVFVEFEFFHLPKTIKDTLLVY